MNTLPRVVERDHNKKISRYLSNKCCQDGRFWLGRKMLAWENGTTSH